MLFVLLLQCAIWENKRYGAAAINDFAVQICLSYAPVFENVLPQGGKCACSIAIMLRVMSDCLTVEHLLSYLCSLHSRYFQPFTSMFFFNVRFYVCWQGNEAVMYVVVCIMKHCERNSTILLCECCSDFKLSFPNRPNLRW